MSNAAGRLLGTLGSGALYSYVGEDYGPDAGSDALRGLAACFAAGTLSSALAALITLRIRDEEAGLRCGPCVCIAAREQRQAAQPVAVVEVAPTEPACAAEEAGSGAGIAPTGTTDEV